MKQFTYILALLALLVTTPVRASITVVTENNGLLASPLRMIFAATNNPNMPGLISPASGWGYYYFNGTRFLWSENGGDFVPMVLSSNSYTTNLTIVNQTNVGASPTITFRDTDDNSTATVVYDSDEQKININRLVVLDGGIAVPSGAQNGYVLTSDGDGLGTWQAPASGSGNFSTNGSGDGLITGNLAIGGSLDVTGGALINGGVIIQNNLDVEGLKVSGILTNGIWQWYTNNIGTLTLTNLHTGAANSFRFATNGTFVAGLNITATGDLAAGGDVTAGDDAFITDTLNAAVGSFSGNVIVGGGLNVSGNFTNGLWVNFTNASGGLVHTNLGQSTPVTINTNGTMTLSGLSPSTFVTAGTGGLLQTAGVPSSTLSGTLNNESGTGTALFSSGNAQTNSTITTGTNVQSIVSTNSAGFTNTHTASNTGITRYRFLFDGVEKFRQDVSTNRLLFVTELGGAFSLTNDGTFETTGPIIAGGTVTGLDPVNDQDYVTKAYGDANYGGSGGNFSTNGSGDGHFVGNVIVDGSATVGSLTATAGAVVDTLTVGGQDITQNGTLTVRLNSDSSLDSTSLTNDSTLRFTLDAGQDATIDAYIFVEGNADGFVCSLTNTTAGTGQAGKWSVKIIDTSGGSQFVEWEDNFGDTSTKAAIDANTVVELHGAVTQGDATGEIVFQWAKNTDVTTAVTLKSYSRLDYKKY